MANSTKTKRRTAAQLAGDGFAAIVEKLGMAEVRYVQLYHHRAGDYARERHEWLDEVSHDQVKRLMAAVGKKKARRKADRQANG